MPAPLMGEFLLLAALWGASFLFMRMGASEFGPMATAGMRVSLAAVFLLPAFAVPGVWQAFRQRLGPILCVGVLNSGLPFALYAFAVVHADTGLISIINATVPLSGAVVAWLWLGERPDASRALGLGIGFAGVLLLVLTQSGIGSPQDTGASWTLGMLAMLASLMATVCYGLGASFARKYLQGTHPLATATGSQISASLGLALPTLWTWPATTPGIGAWSAMLAVALLCTSLAYILYFRIIAQAGASKALTVTFVVPVFAMSYGVLFLHEQITAWMLICGAIILAGTALATGLIKVGATRRAS
ncbi:MAG: DMT family transporter [Burkholderiaceae bacterium]